MPLKIRVSTETISQSAKEAFENQARFVFGAYSRVRRSRAIPASSLELILTDHFVEEVRRLARREEEPDFNPERVGGLVVGKTLSLDPDFGRVAVVFDAASWRDYDEPTGQVAARSLFLIAHELAHPILSRAEFLSGALQAESTPAVTGSEIARAKSRILSEEYRADTLADLILGKLCSKTLSDGSQRSLRAWDLFGDQDISELAAALTQAQSSWPDTVQAYRERKIDLTTLWYRIAASTCQTLTLLTHTQALADANEQPNLLGHERLADLRALSLYLSEPWSRFLETLRSCSTVPTLKQAREETDRIARDGELMLRSIWRRLGLEVEELGNRGWKLWVSEPMR